jgi:hypothetical protein
MMVVAYVAIGVFALLGSTWCIGSAVIAWIDRAD